jgi:hypothetical protein
MDASVGVSYVLRFSNLMNIDPALVFTVLIMGPVLLLIWLVNTKQNKQLTNKMYDIRITELPEKLDFFYTPSNPFLWIIFGAIVPLLLWQYVFLKFFSSSDKTYFLVMYIFAMALNLLMTYDRSRYVYEPAVILSSTGIQYRRHFYSWDAIEKIEVVEHYKSTDTLVLSLKQSAQIHSPLTIIIDLAGFKQKWLPQYAEEYFLRCRTGGRAV